MQEPPAERAHRALLGRAGAVSRTGRLGRVLRKVAPRERSGAQSGPATSDNPAPARLYRTTAHVRTSVRDDSGSAAQAGAPRRHPPPHSASAIALLSTHRWPRAARRWAIPGARWGGAAGESSRSWSMSDPACSDHTSRRLLAIWRARYGLLCGLLQPNDEVSRATASGAVSANALRSLFESGSTLRTRRDGRLSHSLSRVTEPCVSRPRSVSDLGCDTVSLWRYGQRETALLSTLRRGRLRWRTL